MSIWMLIGFALRLDANGYLLIGAPMTVLFQLLVAKAPLRGLWVHNAPRMKIRGTKLVARIIALAFAAANAVILYQFAIAGYWLGAI